MHPIKYGMWISNKDFGLATARGYLLHRLHTIWGFQSERANDRTPHSAQNPETLLGRERTVGRIPEMGAHVPAPPRRCSLLSPGSHIFLPVFLQKFRSSLCENPASDPTLDRQQSLKFTQVCPREGTGPVADNNYVPKSSQPPRGRCCYCHHR